MRLKNISFLLLLIIVSSLLNATMLNVPAQYSTIQSAINASTNGDTVLVHPGTYVENINFNGKNIVVGSLILTTQDTSYISSTIIDGNQNGSVVTFENGEDSTAELSGLTITNGSSNLGGGILCEFNSNPFLNYLIIKNNSVSDSGGGIYASYSSNPVIMNCKIMDNTCVHHGGGILIRSESNPKLINLIITGNNSGHQGGGVSCIYNSHPYLSNVIIHNNIAKNYGGGIFCSDKSRIILNYVTITGNTATREGCGIYQADITSTVCNSIIWNNTPQEIYAEVGNINASYSNIQGGWIGECNINLNPIFTDTTNHYYTLSDYSPCIGAGIDSIQIDDTWYFALTTDIDGNPRPNPAGSKPDMGAYENSRGFPLDAPPSPPQNLTATPGNQQVTLRWSKNTESDLHKYNIYRDTSSPATTLIDNVVGSPPDTFYVDTGLTNGQVYYYRITAVDSAGNESDFSEEVSAIPNPVTIYVSTSGNDSNSGTASNPLRNIQTALSRANSGYTIKVAEGTYEEGLIPQNPVVLLGGYTDNFSESERHRFNHKTIVQAVSATILTDNKGCTVDGFVFDGNSVCDLGIKLTDGSVFTHNLVWRVNAFAAHSMETNGGAVVVNNTIVESGYGLDIYSGSGTPVFKNNIIAHTNFGVNTIGYSYAVRSYNNVYGNTYNYIGFDDTPGIGDISLNPQFVDLDNGDFRLQESSPCIDRGDPDAQYNDPDGSRNDIGAYNYEDEFPSAPTDLTATPGPAAAGQVTLCWNPNTESDFHKYNIYRDTSSPASTLIDSVGGSTPDTFYVDTGLTNGQIYYYCITAVDNAGNESGFSEEVSATPFTQSQQITSVNPLQNALNVSKDTDISVTFGIDINSSTINENTFIVHASQTGFHNGNYSYDSGTKTATFDPDNNFTVGEIVTAILTKGIQSLIGDPLPDPYEWSFTVEVDGGSGKFAAKTEYTARDGPYSVFSSDLDGDGDMDLAVANLYFANVSVLLNNGDGTYTTKTDYTVGDSPRSVFSSDLDGDGDMDMAVANWYSNNVSVLLNNGDGTFIAKTDYTAGDGPRSVFSSDLDGDGDMDLAVANEGSDNVSVLLNNGDGTFSAKTDYTVGDNPLSVFSSDLDDDGDMDLAVANSGSDNVSVLLNRSSEADISISSNSLNFGGVKIDSTKSLQFKVYNQGVYSTLEISNITSSNSVFVPSPTTASILPEDSTTITIIFTPIAMTSYSDSLTISSNDPDDPMVYIYVNGLCGNYGLADTPWPKFRGNARNTGQSQYIGPQTNRLVWSFQSGSFSESSPAIGSDGTVYIGSWGNRLYAINPDGTLKWSYQTGSWIRSSPAIGCDGTVYVGSDDGKLYAINSDEILKWSYQTGDSIGSSPAIGGDGTIYVGSGDDKLYAINPDGALKWSYQTGAGIFSSPAIGGDGTVYVGSDDYELYAINSDGTLKWSYRTGNGIISSPAIGSDGTVYVGSEDRLYAINSDGTLKWSYQTGETIYSSYSSPAIGSDGTVYVGSVDPTYTTDNKLYAINSDGTLKWSCQIGGSIYSSPAIGSDGVVYVGSTDYKLYAINPDGALKWSYQTEGGISSSPAIGSDGTLYIGSWDGKLYAFQDLDEENPTVTLSSPASGETIYCESIKEIKWEASDNIIVSNIALYYSIDNGTNYIAIDTTEVNDSSYTWTIPNTPSDRCKVKIIARDGVGNTATDISDGTFTIADTTKPNVQLISLNGGERLGIGLTDTIRFSISDNVGISYYKIFFSSDNGLSYQLIDSLSSIRNSYIWNVPILFSDKCLVKIIAADSSNNIGEDFSNSTFEITDLTDPEVALVTPTGGEEFVGALEYTIGWTASDNYKLALAYFYFSSDNGKTYSIFDSTNARDFTYNWIAPDIRSDSCKLKIVVKDSIGNSASDSTKEVFKVGRGPTAFLTTPATEQSGDVIIEYQLWDKQRDKLSFTSYYSIDSGENCLKANVVGDTSNIDSLHYDNSIIWKSGIDIPYVDKSTIRFKILVSDTAIGMSGHTGDFHVDNNELPSIGALFTPSEEQTGDITIKFCPSDSENDILHYIFKYSVLSDIEWNNATVDFQFDNMQIPADTLSVTWLSQLDIPDQELETVKFCIFPCDNDTGLPSITGAFHIDNETGPIVIGNYPREFALWQDTIIIDFDRRIDTTSLPGNIEVSGTRSGEISGKNLFSDNIQSLFFIPGNPFMAKETLSVKLGAVILDSLGKGLDGDRDGDPEGSPIDDYTWSFETPYLADYDYSDRVDVSDLIIFANTWKSDPQDLSKEIGPVSGTLPDFVLIPDHVVDFEDFVTLARMWNWSLGLGKISDMFTGGLGKMAAQQPQSEKPLQTVRRKDKYIYESRDLVFNRKSSVRRYAESPVNSPKIPIIYLNPKISDNPWKNSKNGCFEIEVKLAENIDVSGTELVLKYNPELISYNGYAKTQNEALNKASEIISNELFALEEEMQSNFDATEDKLIFERKEEGTVLLNIAQLSNECIFANSEGNIVKLTFCVVNSGVSDIEYLYSVYNSNARLLVNERSEVQIDSKLLIPEDYAIYQNYPNPFNSNTIIKYQIPFESKTTINIYDITGRIVNTLVDERQTPGYYLSGWDGRNNSGQIVSSGMYIYQIISLSEEKDFVNAKKLLLLK